MKDIKDYQEENFEGIKHLNEEQREFWYARELQVLLGYRKWVDFIEVVDKAKRACRNSDINISDHFMDVKKIALPSSGNQISNSEIILSRYACYLIVQNSDPAKRVVALGQTYLCYQAMINQVKKEGQLEAQENDISGI